MSGKEVITHIEVGGKTSICVLKESDVLGIIYTMYHARYKSGYLPNTFSPNIPMDLEDENGHTVSVIVDDIVINNDDYVRISRRILK